jgi:hypothetical protein
MNTRFKLDKSLFLSKFKFVLFCSLVLAVVSSLFISLKILIVNFTNQIYSGYGLGDEGFLLGMLRLRSQGNVENHIWPFTEVLRIPFEISGGNIFLYRLIGILVIAGLFCYLLLAIKNANFDKFIFVVIATVTSSLFLTFPTPFNFLLITPGYQWILIVSSTVVTFLMIFRKNLQDFNNIEIFLVNMLVIFSILARPTGGIVTLALIGIYAAPNIKFFSLRIFLPQCFIWATVFFLNILNLRGRFFELYQASQVNQQKGYNLLLNEKILDIGLPFLFCAAAITLSFLISLRVGNEIPLEKYQKYLIGLSTVTIVWLLTLELSKSKMILFLAIYAFFLGCFSSVICQKIDIVLKLLLLSFLPFFSQFGSTVPSLVNPLYLFLSLSLFFVSLLIHVGKTCRNTDFKFDVQLMIISILFLYSIFYVSYAKQINNETYEKSVGEFATAKSITDGLMYNEFRLQKLDDFNSQANIGGKNVTDLSFFHPGLITFAGGHIDGWITSDKYFIESIDQAFSFLLEKNDPHMFSKDSFILLESGQLEKPNSACRPITSYILATPLSEALLDNELNVDVQLVATYESSPEEVNLYPNYAVLVQVC